MGASRFYGCARKRPMGATVSSHARAVWRLADHDAEFTDLIRERLSRDLEERGGAVLIACDRCERFFDQFTPEPRHGVLVRTGYGTNRLHVSQTVGQMFDVDRARVAGHRMRSSDRVLQLPDIT